MTSPSDGGLPRPPHEGRLTVPEEERQARPLPCPECGSTRGYTRVGNYRSQCKGCNALLKNEEVDMQLSNEEKR
jgi:ribosomal protein L37AE/L43A